MDSQSQVLKQARENSATGVKATFASEFSKPVHAVIEGEPVRLTHVGNVEGMSPAYLVVDQTGRSFWVAQKNVTIIDPDYLPTSVESLASIRDALIGQPGQVGSGRRI